jgi:HD-GYP domain-containing protein (c-di-GMP phosphodiesterase class II)
MSTPKARESKTSTHGELQPTLIVLENLLDALTETTSSAPAVRATVQAICSGTGADFAFWHSRLGAKTTVVAGESPMAPEHLTPFARKLIASIPIGQDVFQWAGPNAPASNSPSAALVARSSRSTGSVVALKFAPGARFDEGDEEVARMALRMLVGIRAHAQTATKGILNGMIHSMNAVLDAKDAYTAGHSERVARIAVLLGKQLGISPTILGDLFLAGLLHDLGKIGVRDEVLWKTGKLSAAEFDEVKQHSSIGERIVGAIEPLRRLCPVVRHHHERFDGTGYPDGLSGEAIPLLARVLCLSDALDAMMSPRRYRPARSPLEIDAVIAAENGKQFDPSIVAAFMGIRDQIYPPIYQKGIGESAYHAIESMVENQTETAAPLPK